MSNEQRKEYFLAEIEEVTGSQANIAAMVSLLISLEPALKRILEEFLEAYREGYLNARDGEEILAYASSRLQRKWYPSNQLSLDD